MSAIIEARSGQALGRTIGVVYLLYFLTAVFGAILVRGIVVPADAATTAANILAHEGLYRAGFAFDLVANVFYIVLTALFYGYFLPVNRTISLIAAFVGLAGCTVQIVAELLRIAPLVILTSAHLAPLLSAQQLQAGVLLSLTLNNESIRIAVLLFAVFDFLIGYLITRSAFVPAVLGMLMMAAGVCWMTILWPPLAVTLHPIILPIGVLAEGLLMLWLIVRGGRPRSQPLLTEGLV
jgi:hypothetical protein